MKRALGILTLAVFVVSLIAPRSAAAAIPDCSSGPATSVPAFAGTMDHASDDCGHGDCGHRDVGSCLSMPGCMTGTVAIRPGMALLVVPPELLVRSAFPASHAGDLYGAGPPTPPPNLI